MKRITLPVVALLAVPTIASANVEIGGIAGFHMFSEDSALGATGDMPTTEKNSAFFGARLGFYFNPHLGIEVEGGVIPTEPRSMTFDVWDITYRAQVVYQLAPQLQDKALVPFVEAGGGMVQVVSSQQESVLAKDSKGMGYIGVGAKYLASGDWGVRVDIRGIGAQKVGGGVTPEIEILTSLYREIGRPKHIKAAPKVEEKPPAAAADTDNDGIVGDADKCPTEAEDKDGFQDDDGCPDTDNDGDGIADANDKCVSDAEDKDNFQDDDGCPDPDNDSDGVPDAADKCPVEPETKNGYLDDDGCADEVPAAVTAILGNAAVSFKANSDAFAGSTAALDKVAKALVDAKDAKVEIAVHTDDVAPKGKFTDSQALSQARADAIKAYLVKKGAADAQITATGYGATKPVVDPTGLKGGALTAARKKNARVEIKLPEAAAAPAPAATPAAPAAPAPAPAAEQPKQ
jgi:outer membrane protein OmpA-like peptidoglycan-associated protein